MVFIKVIKLLVKILVTLNIIISALTTASSEPESKIKFTWQCEFHNRFRCIKKLVTHTTNENIQSFKVCSLLCGSSSIIWPKPVFSAIRGQPLCIKNTLFENTLQRANSVINTQNIRHLLAGAIDVFKERIRQENSTNNMKSKIKDKNTLKVSFKIKNTDDINLTLKTDEQYHLSVRIATTESNMILASIEGETFYGVRHGLETLSQIIVYDNIKKCLLIPEKVEITDFPKYPYRGVMVDTSRNYISVASIKRTIDAMSMNKMNRFHWHFTDTHSFPMKLKKYEKFAEYGAYSPEKVYSEVDIKSIMEYAMIRGVRIVPELDAPAHTGEGWQGVPDALTCFKILPWESYCPEPPCGQLNPLTEEVYETLGGFYEEYMRLFQADLFHMGGDEVSLPCWKTSEKINNWISTKSNEEAAFYELWNEFQAKAYNKLIKASEATSNPKPEAILWTSKLISESNIEKLKMNDYIIQVWDSKLEEKNIFGKLLDNNFRIILSNFDALYLDCGYGSWVTSGTDWCTPYKTWHTLYKNSVNNKMKIPTIKEHLILGQEAALWTETATEESLDLRLWPRVSALGERTWSDPDTRWQDAESRFLYHRDRMVQLGIKADAVQPEWCNINTGGCARYDDMPNQTNKNAYVNPIIFFIFIFILTYIFIYFIVIKIRKHLRRRQVSSPRIQYSHLKSNK